MRHTVVPDPASPDDTTEIGIQSLTVDGDIMTLRFSATPDFASKSDSEEIALSEVMGSGHTFVSSQIKLLDRVNLKEYSVLYGDGKWWATDHVDSVNGTPALAYAVFAAPEDDIDTVDISFNEQFEEFTDVPIERESE